MFIPSAPFLPPLLSRCVILCYLQTPVALRSVETCKIKTKWSAGRDDKQQRGCQSDESMALSLVRFIPSLVSNKNMSEQRVFFRWDFPQHEYTVDSSIASHDWLTMVLLLGLTINIPKLYACTCREVNRESFVWNKLAVFWSWKNKVSDGVVWSLLLWPRAPLLYVKRNSSLF